MAGQLKLFDTVTFSLLDANLGKIKDDYEGAFKPQPQGQTHHSGMGTVPGSHQMHAQQQQGPQAQGLLVAIAATHSGIITRNNGLYLPDKMKKGADTFTENFGKPILLHHDDKQDAVGRVIGARYVDTAQTIQDSLKGKEIWKNGKKVYSINDSFLEDFTSGAMPFGQQVDVVRDVLRHTILDEVSYEGLGYIELIADITDPDAIQKLLDGRYLTGSVGATTNKAVCSVCRTDWTDGGPCEHKPGGIYDGAKCFIIAGDLSYDEYSFVNKPADRHSRVMQLQYNGLQDSIETTDDYEGRVYEVQLQFPQYDSASKEEGSMAKKKADKVEVKDAATETESKAPNAEASTEAEGTADKVEVKDSKAESTENKTEENIQDSDESKSEEIQIEDSKGNEESLEDFVTRVLSGESEITDADKERSYKVVWDEVEAAVKDGALHSDVAKQLTDEKRATLPKSSFADPANRLFPVSDCAHVTAVRRLVAKSKISDELKANLTALADRKAKVFGCTKTQKKEEIDATQVQENMQHSRIMRMILATIDEDAYYNEEPVLMDEEMKMMQNLLVRLSKLVGKDNFQKGLYAEGFAREETALLDQIAEHEETIVELRDHLEAVRKDHSLLFQDMENLQDEVIKSKTENRKVKEDHLKLLTQLQDAKVEEEYDFTTLEDSALDSKVTELVDKVDVVSITDKLGDGMSRVPNGTVDSPVDIQDSEGSTNQKSKEQIIDDLLKVQDNYYHMLFGRGGEIAANRYLERMVQDGVIVPQDVEKILGGSN